MGWIRTDSWPLGGFDRAYARVRDRPDTFSPPRAGGRVRALWTVLWVSPHCVASVNSDIAFFLLKIIIKHIHR